jgi:hypothetical protein
MKKWANELNRAFSNRAFCPNGQKHMKKCSPFLAIEEMQIKTTSRFHLTPVRMASSRTQTINVGEDMENSHLIRCWWECKLVQPLWKTVWRLLKKLKIELPYDPVMPLLGMYLK